MGLTREQLLDRVDAQVRAEIDGGLAGVAHAALTAREQGGPAPMAWSPQAVIEVALEEVQRSKAGWTEADLVRAINAALPDYLGLSEGQDVAELLDQLTRQALTYAHTLDAARPGDEHLPSNMRLRNGDSAYQAPGARLYATPGQVRTERDLVAATAAGGAAAIPREGAQRFLDRLREEGLELGVDQAAAVRGVLTSGARVESLVGPAGTGKSFVVGTLARAWSDPTLTGGPQRRVFGLATSQIATDVLTAEGLTARNVTRWLNTQTRLHASAGEPGPVGDDEAWRLRAGDLVVVDESAMTDTAALAATHRRVDAAGAKLLLVGDHRQLAAVGAGGGMDLLARAGARYELAEARRFAAEWERTASLRLRAGDPEVLRDYHRQGRLLDAGTREQAEQSAARAWLADTLAGRRSLLLVDTNEQAARVSAELRAELVRLGRVAEHGVPLGMQGTYAGVGDLVQARFNAWRLAGIDGNRRGPINRETYRVTAVRDDGGLEVTTAIGDGPGERMVLPADYVAQHLTLAYASTVHAAQGQTVDTSHAVITSSTSPAALYVALSRGRGTNVAHVATQSVVDDPARGSDAHSLHRDPVAVLAGILDRSDIAVTRSALATAAESAQGAGTVRTAAELLVDAAQLAATERTATWLDELADAGALTREQRARIAAEDGAASLTRVLRRAELAGHDSRAELRQAITDRPLDGARNLTNVIYSRITDGNTRRFDPVGDSWASFTPQVEHPEWGDYLSALAMAADERAADLAAELAETPPSWALDALGPVPDDLAERQAWQQRAAVVAGYRELSAHHDDDALGPAPKPGQVEAYAAYRAAWRALGRPEIDRAEHEMSDGALRSRIRAWEREQTWAPRYVGNELAGTRQAADAHRQTAALRAAEAAAAPDEAERARLDTEAREAAALADVLDERAAQLQQLDDARAEYLAHTAATRANADVARYLLAERHADAEPEQQVTAEEWLAAERAARSADDQHRAITEHDLAEEDTVQHMERAAVPTDHVLDIAEPDVREIATCEPAPVREDDVRVPSADEVAAALAQANRSITEIRARAALDEQADAAERVEQLVRWHTDDVQLDDARAVEDDLVYDRGTA
ncbi:AAA family ATPase [Pseudonocardia sp.]|uniref:AAA family ATPase n=1 Tax=Pseudonocardia sp. TaxID=60912 RepID=UPI003D14EAFE